MPRDSRRALTMNSSLEINSTQGAQSPRLSLRKLRTPDMAWEVHFPSPLLDEGERFAKRGLGASKQIFPLPASQPTADIYRSGTNSLKKLGLQVA